MRERSSSGSLAASVAVWVYGDSGFAPVLPLLVMLAFIPAALATALGVALRR